MIESHILFLYYDLYIWLTMFDSKCLTLHTGKVEHFLLKAHFLL